MYAFGVVLWEIGTCLSPYGMDVATTDIPGIVQGGGRPDMRMLTAHPLRAPLIPKRYGELVARCWMKEPGLRPSMKDVMRELQRMFPMDPWSPPPRKEDSSAQDSAARGNGGDGGMLFGDPGEF